MPTETSRQVDGGGCYITWPGHLLTETGFAGNRGPNINQQPICISLVTYGEVAMETPCQVDGCGTTCMVYTPMSLCTWKLDRACVDSRISQGMFGNSNSIGIFFTGTDQSIIYVSY